MLLSYGITCKTMLRLSHRKLPLNRDTRPRHALLAPEEPSIVGERQIDPNKLSQ